MAGTGLNKVLLIGNLGKDPEFKYTPGGQAVATFSLATTEKFSDKGGQRQERTEWHNIVAWGKTAELVNQYLKKGRTVYIEGRLTTRSWDDKDGVKKYKTEIVASSVLFLGGNGGGSGNNEMDMPSAGNQSFGSHPMNSAPDSMVEEDLPF